jgi:flavin reductase (DIM6/NTAB) family NADH-FMN oxidoreductase RutF
MPEEFAEVRILDNFYQTSSFFPMPVVLVSTFAESGRTNLGPYSLCFPHIVTGKSEHSMMLIARGTSNTAGNIVRTKVCTLNFIPDKKKYMKNCVALGYPGETTEEKMKNSIFTLLPANGYGAKPRNSDGHTTYPDIVKEAVQVFLCSWNENYPLKQNEDGMEYHFLLRIDKIIMEKKWKDNLLQGKGFPALPIDYGYRDNVRFWFTKHSQPYAIPIPKEKGNTIETVRYACTRFDPDIKWEDEACAKLLKVPAIFLNRVIGMIVDAAKEEGIAVITPQFLDKIQDKRSSER